jgi:hypothetical protein
MEMLLEGVSAATLERWEAAYHQMAKDALVLGIPASALPVLPARPTEAELRRARDHLGGMVDSFLSAAL